MPDPAVRLRVGVCVCDGDRLLVVQHEKHGLRYWLLPGGGVEPGETLLEAAARELTEETGHTADVERLFLVCESIEPGGRHIVNLMFAGRLTGGRLAVGADRALRDAAWRRREELRGALFYPPVLDEVLAGWEEGFAGPVRVLGNVWQPLPDQRAARRTSSR